MKHTLLVCSKKHSVFIINYNRYIVTIDCKQKLVNIHRSNPVTLVRPI